MQPDPPGYSSDNDSRDSVNLSATDIRLRHVIRDMVRVLHIPDVEDSTPDIEARKSFKKHTGPIGSRSSSIPVLPVDRLCADRIEVISGVKKWRPVAKRDVRHFRVPKNDFEKYFSVPTLPDAARDKIAADSGGRSTLKSPFPSKEKNTLEDTLVKVDKASKEGLRVSCFLQLLSEYLVCACEADSLVTPESVESAFRCLDDCLRICMDQFSRVSSLSTSVRRGNVLDAIFLPTEGARTRLEALPRLGKDLFDGKFQLTLEEEAKRIKATDKINQRRSTQGPASAGRGGKRGSGPRFPRKPLQPFKGPNRSASASPANPYSGSPTPQPLMTPGPAFGGRGRGSGPSYTPRSKANYGSGRGRPWRR